MATNIFCVLLLLSSCNTDNSNKQQFNIKNEVDVYTDSLAVLSMQWKSDSLGCDKVRSINIFDRLLKGYSLEQKSKTEFINALGVPNEEEKYTNKTILIYYFNSICNANIIVKQSDKSSIRIIFDLQKKYKEYDTRIE